MSPYPIDAQGSLQALQGTSDEPLGDWDPSEPGDPWSDYLDLEEVIYFSRQHLARCLLLDPARHDHS